jgi:hypothetical protein
MDYKPYEYEDNSRVDEALCEIFLDQFIKENGVPNGDGIDGWCKYINKLNLGIRVDRRRDLVGKHTAVTSEHWIYTVIDIKTWFFTQLKYGLTFRNPEPKE